MRNDSLIAACYNNGVPLKPFCLEEGSKNHSILFMSRSCSFCAFKCCVDGCYEGVNDRCRSPGRSVPEFIVQPDLDDVNLRIDVEVWKHGIAKTIRPARQVYVVVFDLCSPIAANGLFNAEAGSPADVRKKL